MGWIADTVNGLAEAAIHKATGERAPGFDGVAALAGYISTGERTPKLQGPQRWRTLASVRRRMPVSIATQLRAALFSAVKWSVEANPIGGEAAQRGADIVQQGLLDARFVGGRSWPQVVAHGADGRYFLGHAVFATAMATQRSGIVGYTDIAHRPQHTIERWLREKQDDESTPFVAVEQRSSTGGQTAQLPLSECFYIVNNSSTDDPRGRAVLDDVAERYERVTNYEMLEARELFSSMGGTPIIRAPLAELFNSASGTDEQKLAEVARKTSALRELVENRVKHPDKWDWAQLDSATYKGANPDTISSIQKWNLELIKGELQGAAEMRAIIRDLDLDIARMLGVEYVLVGGGDTAGSFGMHESKISMLGASLSAESMAIARAADDQLVRRLIAANGLDPDTAAPTLVPSPIAVDDVLKVAQMLVAINAAGLAPNHPAKIALFERANLPWQEEKERAPMLPSFGLPSPTDVLGDPTPEQALRLSKKGKP